MKKAYVYNVRGMGLDNILFDSRVKYGIGKSFFVFGRVRHIFQNKSPSPQCVIPCAYGNLIHNFMARLILIYF